MIESFRTTCTKLNEAKTFVRSTLCDGDAGKWAVYQAARKSSYEAGRAWIITVGHGEFARLQRLNFHGLI